MADVGDIEDFLAALDDDTSKILQHNQSLAPRMTTDHHQNLPQMHANSSLPVLQDQLNFDSLEQHGLQLHHNQHMGTSQLMTGLEHGMGHMPRNDLIAGNVIDDAFSSHIEQSDQSAIQAGSSLGSLFLDSVDEILSNEKTTHSVGFTPPNVQSVAAKPQRSKSKKPIQHKNDKPQPHSAVAIDQNINSSQQMGGGNGSAVTLKNDEQSMVRGIPGNIYNSGSRVQPTIGQQQEAFSRTVYRQQGAQMSRPQSNTSCESSFYPGSVPQPSPSGDSNLGPRTPHSNNPLTPQSVIRPNTPQSNQSIASQANRSASATPLVQMQQNGILNDSSFLQMDHSPPPPVIPDDQSHLQYLNTTTSISQSNADDISIDDSLLDDLPTPVKNMFPDKFSLPDFSSFNIPSSDSTQPPAPQAPGPMALWPATSMSQSNAALSIGQAQHAEAFKFDDRPKQTVTSGFTTDTQQLYPSMRASAASANFQQPAYVVSSGSNQTSFMGYPNNNRSAFSSSSLNYGTGTSEGLSLSQSQILDNPMEWGKSKQKSTVSVSKTQPTQSSANQQTSSQRVSHSRNTFQQLSKESSVGNSHVGNTSNNTVINMLNSAETGIKQIFSQPSRYEAVSPISDYSPVRKEPDASFNENLPSGITSMGAQGQLPASNIALQRGMAYSRARENEEKLKAGPLARRRSASNEQKQSQNMSKKVDSGEFNFGDGDEFGFDQSEPTIRLPTKRADNSESTNAKQVVATEMSKPILASTIQRENYSDPSVFDSVQELAILQQKRKSLMDKLQASRNMKTLPQKPPRVAPKVAGISKSSNIAQQQTINKRSSTTTAKPSRPRKPSKSDSVKEGISRPSAKTSSNQSSNSQSQKEKSARFDEVVADTDLFCQQFLNDTVNPTKHETVMREKSTFSSLPHMAPVSASSFSMRSSANSQDTRSVPQGYPASHTGRPTQLPTGHQVSGSGNNIFDMMSGRTHAESTDFQANAKTNQSPSVVTTYQSTSSGRNTSIPPSMPLNSNSADMSVHLKASQQRQPPAQVVPSSLTSRGDPKDQALYRSSTNPFQSTIKASSYHPKASHQLASTTNSSALQQMYTNYTMENQTSFPGNKNADAATHEKLQTKARSSSEIPISTLTSSSVSIAQPSVARQPTSSKTNPQLVSPQSATQKHLEVLQSFLAKQPVEVTTASNISITSSATHISNSKHAHSIPGVGSSKAPTDRYPILPDMSQIQFDYTTSPSLTSTVSVFPSTAQPAQRFPSVSSSASTWSIVSPATTTESSQFSKSIPPSSTSMFQPISFHPPTAIDTLSQVPKRPENKNTAHTISQLQDPANAPHLSAMKRSGLAPNYSFPPGHDALSYGNVLNAPYVGGANRFSSPIAPNQAAVQQSLEFLRLTQQRFEKQSADTTLSSSANLPPSVSANFSPSVCTASITTSSISTLPAKSSVLPTYQQSVGIGVSSIYGNLQSQQTSTNVIETAQAKHPQEVLSQRHRVSTATHNRTLPTEGTSAVASDLHITNSASKAPIPLDFSSKITATDVTPALVKSTSSMPHAHVQTKTTGTDPSPLPSTTNILKDRTYHGPKKKHILEKYCQQTLQSSTASVTPSSKPPHVSKSRDEKSGFGKARKASTDKTTLSHSKNETSSSDAITRSSSATASSVMSEKISASSTTTPRSRTGSKTSNTGDSKKTAQRSDSKSSNKDEQTGSSIFTLFDSLLQEAAESAKGSLKNDQGKKKDKNQSKTTKSTPKDGTKQNSKKAKEASKNKEVAVPLSVLDIPDDSSSIVSSEKNSLTSASAIPTVTTSVTTSAVTSTVTNTTTNRTPAYFPFKRRHVHTQNKIDEPSDASVSGTGTLKASSLEPTITSAPQISSAPATTPSLTSTAVDTGVPVSKLATVTSSHANMSQLPAKQTDVPTPNQNAQPASGGLKLKITTFRSSGGLVIHQSTALGDLVGDVDDEEESDDSSKFRKKKKKYKNRKKRRQRSSSSDSSDSSSPQVTVPKIVPSAPVASRFLSSSSNSEADHPDIPGTNSSFNSGLDSAAGSGSAPNAQKRKKKIVKSLRQPSLKRHLLSISSDVHSEAGKPKKLKQTAAKKVPNKSVPRYKLKTAHTQASSTGDVTMSFNRAPGKPPLYLNAGANQLLVSGSGQSVPTIQLVPRTTVKTATKAVAPASVVTSQSAAKLLSVKLSGKAIKTVQGQTVTKSTVAGVRYLLPTTTPVSNVPISPRIIIPKLTSPSFPVGKATVFTVSSSGARVSGTPSIQIQPTPVQTSSSVAFPSVVSPTQPVIVKRVPVPLLPKVTISSHQKTRDAAPPVTAASTSSPVVSFTSKPVQASSKVVTPKPFFSSTGPGLKAATSNRKSPIGSVIAEALEAVATHTHSKNSREQEFQSAFSKLISSPSPLNKYTPSPVPPQYLDLPESSELSAEQCLECGDVFYFRSSLQHHYDRRSIVVKVRCVQCNQMLVFFNKCEILRHAREHSDHGEVMQFNGANLSPIPLSLCKSRSKEYFLKAAQVKVETRKSSELKTTGCAMACTECTFVTDGQGTLEDHFQRRNDDLRMCDICKLPLHNQCVFSAHMRMHRHAAPHTCPECGQTFDGDKMEFNLHLRIQCFHLSRASCYKCKLCNLTFITEDQLRHHLRLNHVQVFYKCRECPMAFKTTQNIANHQRSAHNLTPEPTNTLKTIHKCPLCDTVFTDSGHSQQLFVLHKHFDGHINSTRITAYKCYLCTSLFEQKAPLRDHLQNEHKLSSLNEVADCAVEVTDDQLKSTQPPASGENEARQSLESKRSHKATKRSNTEEKRKETPLSPQVKIKRMKLDDSVVPNKTSPGDDTRAKQPFKIRIKGMKGGPSKTRCVSSDDDDDEQPLLSPKRKLSVVTTPQGKKTYPCPECEKVFLSSHSRSSHIRSIHRGIRALYCCTRCPVGSTKYAKRITLVKHLKKAHNVSSVQKDDVKIVRTHLHYLSPGTKFKASSVHVDKNGVVTPEKPKTAPKPYHPEKRLPRKKITGRHPVQARARRMAAIAGNKMRMKMKGGKVSISEESEESYGEVDEKAVEEGWSFDEDLEPNKENEDVGEIDDSAFNFPDIYTCIKCDFQHSDRLVFQAHIVEHSQSLEAASALTMVQCTECGLSFASCASLEKHLYIKHKIKHRHLLERYDAKLRVERENEPLSDLNVELNSAGGSKVFRCKVCLHKFDAETELKTHMRTHGLAFVKSKQH